jgi:hypothetical protein
MITVRRVAIASAILALFAIHVIADAAPSCTLPPGMVSVPLKQVPSILLQTIIDDVGEIAPPMGRFDRTDVMMVGLNRRFAFFWKADDKWIVATEHGGFAYNNPIFLYDLGGNEQKAVLTAQAIASPNTLCAVASGLISSQ